MSKSEKFSNRPFTRLCDREFSLKNRPDDPEKNARPSQEGSKNQIPPLPKNNMEDQEHHLTTNQDHQMFLEQMNDVTPLADKNNFYVNRSSRPILSYPTSEEQAIDQLTNLVSGKSMFDITYSDEHIDGLVHGLDRRILKHLKQGQFVIQDHLDLHGKTRKEARPIVEKFIIENRFKKHRCILIIHGRGHNSKNQIPVLKESLKQWLTSGQIGKSVLAFCSARPVDGGMGAIYVLLKK